MLFLRVLKDEQGATAIEYSMIAALIAVAAVTAMQSLGNEIFDKFDGVATDLEDARN
jgi:pilus assembly protein Flp/PilA